MRITQWRRDQAGPHLRDALRLLDRLLEAAEAGARMDRVIEVLILRALALHAQNDLNAALAALERALTLAAPEGYVRVFLDEGQPMAALLHEAHSHGIAPGYVATLLAAFPTDEERTPANSTSRHTGGSQHSALSTQSSALTERELEVLRLLAAGHSNQEIAGELVVAVGTVKRHVNNIMSKLQAQSRLQAVTRARELNLV